MPESDECKFILKPKISFEIPKRSPFHYVGLDDIEEKLQELRNSRSKCIFKEIKLMSRSIVTNEDEWSANNYAKVKFDLSVLRKAFPEHYFWQKILLQPCVYPDCITIVARIIAGNVPSQEEVVNYLKENSIEADLAIWLLAAHANNPAIMDELVNHQPSEFFSHVLSNLKRS